MDTGWTTDPDVSAPERMMVIRSRKLGRILMGTCQYIDGESEGFWFLTVTGTRFHLSGKW